jgi:hypothetical protein
MRRPDGPIQLTREEGWALTPPGMLPLAGEAVAACLALFQRRKSALQDIKAAKDAKKDTYFYDVAERDGFEEYSDLLQDFMTQDAILAPVMRYLGEFPVYQGAKLFWTPANDLTVSSQQWHTDGLDTQQVKFFFYLSDIDADAGPTTILSRSDSRRVLEAAGHIKSGGFLSDEEVAAIVPRDRWIPLIGKTGTLATCDTSSCFHFGGRSRARERLFLLFHFSTSAPFKTQELPRFHVKSWKDRMLLDA